MRDFGLGRWRAAALGALVLTMPVTGGAAEESARDLVKRVLEAAPKVSVFAKMTLSSHGLVRELEMSRKRVDDADVSYLEVTAPNDVKDTRFLFFERTEGRDEQFIYIPIMKRSIQVSEETRKQPFLGSEFYVSDLVAPELDAHTYSFAGEEEVGGRRCKLVESVPKTPGNEPYSKTVLSIDPADLLVLKTQFFDPKGKLMKVWTVSQVEKVDGIWTPLLQEMANVQANAASKLELKEVKYNAELPDHIFSRNYLVR